MTNKHCLFNDNRRLRPKTRGWAQSVVVFFVSFFVQFFFLSPFALFFFSAPTFAANFGITYEGRIITATNEPLVANRVDFVLRILESRTNCLLYSEKNSADMSSGDGIFSLTLGKGTRLEAEGTLDLEDVFNPQVELPSSPNCSNGYKKQPGDQLYLNASFNYGAGPQVLLPLVINASPYAMDTVKVAGVESSNVLRVSGSPAAPLSSQSYTYFLSLLNGTANFISQGLSSRSLTLASPSNSQVMLTAPAGSFENFTLVLPNSKGNNGQVLASDGNGALSWMTLGGGGTVTKVIAGAGLDGGEITTTGTISLANTEVTAGTYGTSTRVPRLTVDPQGRLTAASDEAIPLAGDTTTGLLSSSDWSVFNAAAEAVNNQATSQSTPDTLVKRNASGETSLRGLTLSNASGNSITLLPADTLTNYSLRWPQAVAPSANSILVSDTAGNLSWNTITNLTGSINLATQVSGVLPIANGGTNSNQELTNNQLMVSTAGAIKELGVMGDGQIVVGKSASAPQIVSVSGDASLSNSGALSVNLTGNTTSKILGTNPGASQLVITDPTTGSTLTNLATSSSSVLLSSAAGVPNWTPLSSDSFSQYALLAGRTTGQTLNGGTAANGKLTLDSTANVAKGEILLNPAGGRVGVGTTSPTAKLHLAAGSADPNMAPLKFTSGPPLNAPEAGAIEFDGTSLFYTTDAGVRQTLGVAGAGLTALTGDVTASGSGSVAATVASVGGSSASSLRTAEQAVNVSATSNSTASVLVKRDANGVSNFKGLALDGATSGTLTQRVPATLTSYSVTWPNGVAGSSNSVLASDTSGNLSWINLGSVTGTISLTSQVTGVLPIANGGTNSGVTLTNNQLMYSNTGAIKELGAMTDGQIVVGKSSAAPQIVSMSGDVTLTNTGATTVAKIAGTSVSGVGLAHNNLLQNTSGAVIAANNVLVSNASGTGVTALASPASGVLTSSGGIPAWSTIASDTFAQYALLAGRSGGQTLNGGTAANDNLILHSTSHATKGYVLLAPTGGNVGIGTTTPNSLLSVGNSSISGNISLNGPNGVAAQSVQIGLSPNLFGTDASGIEFKNVNGTTNRFYGARFTGAAGYTQFNNGVITSDWNGPSSSDMLSLNRNGSTRFRINDDVMTNNVVNISGASGTNLALTNWSNIGIGTSSPGALLDVYKASGYGIRVGQNGNYYLSLGSGIDWSAGSGDFILSSNQGFQLKTGSTTKLAITNSGNVGIGTTTPTSPLSIVGDTASNVGIAKFSISGNANDYFQFSNGTPRNDVFIPSFNAKVDTSAYGGNGVYGLAFTSMVNDVAYPNAAGAGAGIYFDSRNYANTAALANRNLFGWGSFNTTKMVMNKDGDLGIGTSSPSNKLSVSGNANFTGNVGIGTASPTVPLTVGPNPTAGFNSNELFQIAKTGDAFMTIYDGTGRFLLGSTGGLPFIGTQNASDFSMRTNNAERVRVTSAGNVGIGTSTPAVKLHVAGAIASATNPIASGAAVNLALSNTHTLASVGGTSIALSNMVDGASYTIIITDATSRTYTFTGCNSYFFKPANGATVVNSRTIYGLLTIRNGANWDCYINWQTGYQ